MDFFGTGGRPGEAVRWHPVDPTRRVGTVV